MEVVSGVLFGSRQEYRWPSAASVKMAEDPVHRATVMSAHVRLRREETAIGKRILPRTEAQLATISSTDPRYTASKPHIRPLPPRNTTILRGVERDKSTSLVLKNGVVPGMGPQSTSHRDSTKQHSAGVRRGASGAPHQC